MEFQLCPKCKQNQPLTEFAFNLQGVRYPICNNIHCRPMAARRKDELIYEIEEYRQQCKNQASEISILQAKLRELDVNEYNSYLRDEENVERIDELSNLLEIEVFKVVNLQNDNAELRRENTRYI